MKMWGPGQDPATPAPPRKTQISSLTGLRVLYIHNVLHRYGQGGARGLGCAGPAVRAALPVHLRQPPGGAAALGAGHVAAAGEGRRRRVVLVC